MIFPNGCDKKIALQALQAKVYQAIQLKGDEWVPYEFRYDDRSCDVYRQRIPAGQYRNMPKPAGQPAEGATTPERYDISSAANSSDRE